MTVPGQEWRHDPPADRTVVHLLHHQATQQPNRTFLAGEGFQLTYGETWERTLRIAGGMTEIGIASEDRVGVWLDNCAEFILSWFAIAISGAVQVPLNPDVAGARLVHALKRAECTTVVLRDTHVRLLEKHLDQLTSVRRLIVLGKPMPSSALETISFDDLIGHSPLASWKLSAKDTAAIMFTSGSTGPAKGVVVPHGQHITNAEQTLDNIRLTSDDVLLLVLPLHHNMAQGYGVMPALAAGCPIWLEPGFQRAVFWDVVHRSQATVFPFVGALLALLDKQDVDPGPHRLRAAYGVPIAADLHERFEKRFGLRLVHGYGSTEATIVTWGPLEGERALGSAGKVLPDFEVEIHDEYDQPLAAGEIGEICIRPRKPYTMFQGYFAEPERGRLAVKNLWFHSGDRGQFDADGNLWFEGRTGDVLRRFGEFLSASEVEQAILEHPDVELVAVVGIADEVAGQELLAVVAPRSGAALSAEELRAGATEKLPAFAVPRYLEVVDELPMTPTGKIEKHRIASRGLTESTKDFREGSG